MGSPSCQRIVILSANRNRNRFTEPNSVRIGIGIVPEIQNLQIGIGIIFANNSKIRDVYFFLKKKSKNFSILTLMYFSFEKFTGQPKPFNIRIRYS